MKKNWKIILSVILACAVMVGVFASCGKKDKETNPSNKAVVVYSNAAGDDSVASIAKSVAKAANDAETVELTAEDTTAAWVDNWEDYDVVFIGYSADDTAAVEDFVKSNDFTDKKVFTFAVSDESALPADAVVLSNLTDTGDWAAETKLFSTAAADKDVSEWVDSLGLNSEEESSTAAESVTESESESSSETSDSAAN